MSTFLGFTDRAIFKVCQSHIYAADDRMFGDFPAKIAVYTTCVGLARTIYIRCIYGILGREIIKYTVIYGIYIYGSGQP
jgi:hypothetical protein